MDILKIHRDSNDVHIPTVALDSAKSKITIDKGTDGTTTFKIRVTGIDVSGIDWSKPVPALGSHLHTDRCMEGDYGTATPSTAPGGQAGPHYNHDVHYWGKAFPKLGEQPSETVAEVSTDTEVWFDLVPDEEGMAYDETTVPFVPVDEGTMSVVVHVRQTNTADNDPYPGLVGSASTRQVCFPLDVSQVFPTS